MRICSGESKIIRRANRKGIGSQGHSIVEGDEHFIVGKEGYEPDDLPLDPSHCSRIEQMVSGSFGVRVAG